MLAVVQQGFAATAIAIAAMAAALPPPALLPKRLARETRNRLWECP
jgi:hypothetical protein